MRLLFITAFAASSLLSASSQGTPGTKEIALTFDDAPTSDTPHYKSAQRTDTLIRKLKELDVPAVMVFANPCKRPDAVIQLTKYLQNGHLIGNHTCSHPRLDEVGFVKYSQDTEKADSLLSKLFRGGKFFRYPYLNEGTDIQIRDKMRKWLRDHGYRHGMVSVDTDDYIFSYKINQAKKRGKSVDYKKIEAALVNHLIGAVDHYAALARETLGYSPKHVLLLHEMDATVMFIGPIVKALRKQGWKIISPLEAYQDPLYSQSPINTYGNDGIISQLVLEKTGRKAGFIQYDQVVTELDGILGL